jgi:hypothetical protein
MYQSMPRMMRHPNTVTVPQHHAEFHQLQANGIPAISPREQRRTSRGAMIPPGLGAEGPFNIDVGYQPHKLVPNFSLI